ncbi:hypothetical protein RND71_001851 [Anisodus tanguticus]|uniref:Uncharacterized protein n=1 Tax=Anisodus tanguticus TaxID=243964 RepID=A0AAE1VYC2_9SOLA|nr:hypothetical protein RND71_001851 [Anisodus tanguticus]
MAGKWEPFMIAYTTETNTRDFGAWCWCVHSSLISKVQYDIGESCPLDSLIDGIFLCSGSISNQTFIMLRHILLANSQLLLHLNQLSVNLVDIQENPSIR